MGYGVGIFLLAVGLILALAVTDNLANVDLTLVGWILTAVGALAIVLTAALPGASFHTSGTCGPAVTQVQVPAGEYRGYFHYTDQVVHLQTLTASSPGLTPASTMVTTVCPAAVDGAACDDADLCNGRETCRGGTCGSGTTLDCDDNDACTADTCAAATGCAHTVIAGCCRSPEIDVPNGRAAVGVPYRIASLGIVPLVKGTGPLRYATCDSPPAGFAVGVFAPAAAASAARVTICFVCLSSVAPWTTFALTKIGNFTPRVVNAELTGTGDGRLYGFYTRTVLGLERTYIGEIEKTSGKVLGETHMEDVTLGGGWAFAFWGGDFYIFLERHSDSSTQVHKMSSKDGTLTTPLPDTGRRIVGAGVSTCAPTDPT